MKKSDIFFMWLGFAIVTLGNFVITCEVQNQLKAEINNNHKIVLSQIQKQINAHTKYIKALRECLEEK